MKKILYLSFYFEPDLCAGSFRNTPLLKELANQSKGRCEIDYATHINLISGGFSDYFTKFRCKNYSSYPNGIDDVFIERQNIIQDFNIVKTITYAGNLGQGQGLDKIVPEAAKKLGDNYRFKIIGDGGAKQSLINEINRLGVTNVELIDPVKRTDLISIYDQSDFLFLHLNDYDAFKKVAYQLLIFYKKANHIRIVKIAKNNPSWIIRDTILNLEGYNKKQIWYPNHSDVQIKSTGTIPEEFKSYNSNYYGVFENKNSLFFDFENTIKTEIILNK